MRTSKILILLGICSSLVLVGCGQWYGSPTAQEEFKTEPLMEIKPCGVSEVKRVTQPYPATQTGEIVRVEKMTPEWVSVNDSFDYKIKVTNLSDYTLQNVVVTDSIPKNLKINTSTPRMHFIPGDHGEWSLGTLEPKGSKIITINAIATQTGTIGSCALVAYDMPICSEIQVIQPKMELSISAPDEVLLCEQIPVEFEVSNPGKMELCGLNITSPLQTGLTTLEATTRFDFNIASLMPGKSQKFTKILKPERTGRYTFVATVTAQGDLEAKSLPVSTTVRQPVLTIISSGPQNRYIGRPVTHDISIANKGDAEARETTIELSKPIDAKFISATEGGQSSLDKVVWNLGTLQPGSSRQISVTLMPEKAGVVTTEASATAVCADTVIDLTQTNVTGITGILLEVIDTDDPIEIGANETYVISVTNQGSATGTNIAVQCTLDRNMLYVSSTGPTEASVLENTITFTPLSSLAPKQKATWRVVVRAVGEADARFKVSMKSDQITSPVQESESTHFYE